MVCVLTVTKVTMFGMSNTEACFLIDRIGGTAEVARLCRVSSQAVSKWRREGIPDARRMYLLAIRPDLAVLVVDADAEEHHKAA